MNPTAAYFYLDKEDGYAKGPYSWNDLKQLPLEADQYIYHQQTNTWQTFGNFARQMSAEAVASVQTAKSRKSNSPSAPIYTQNSKANEFPEQRTTTTTKTGKVSQTGPINFPPAPRPNFPAFPDMGTENPMGISGKGCFIIALGTALLLCILFFLI